MRDMPHDATHATASSSHSPLLTDGAAATPTMHAAIPTGKKRLSTKLSRSAAIRLGKGRPGPWGGVRGSSPDATADRVGHERARYFELIIKRTSNAHAHAHAHEHTYTQLDMRAHTIVLITKKRGKEGK